MLSLKRKVAALYQLAKGTGGQAGPAEQPTRAPTAKRLCNRCVYGLECNKKDEAFRHGAKPGCVDWALYGPAGCPGEHVCKLEHYDSVPPMIARQLEKRKGAGKKGTEGKGCPDRAAAFAELDAAFAED